MGLDYTINPIVRRIVLVKESDSIASEEFIKIKGGLVKPEDFTPEQTNLLGLYLLGRRFY